MRKMQSRTTRNRPGAARLRRGKARQVLGVRNAELIESLTRQAAEHGITDDAIVTLIGAADSFTGSAPAGDPTAHTITSNPPPTEMTATGEIIDGKPHIHAVLAIQGDRVVAGHPCRDHLAGHDPDAVPDHRRAVGPLR
jgi:hypothetical protein